MSEEQDTGNETTQTDSDIVADVVDNADQSQESGWMFAEGTPGTGDTPEWFKADKYGTVSDQAKAYKELEVRFGSFTGAPEEYTVNLSDELKEKGIEITSDDPLYEEALKFAKETNMNQEGFDNMLNLYAMSKVAETDAINQHKAEELASLGDNAQARVDNLNKWGKANLSDELYNGFQEMATSANAVRAMEKLVSMTRNAPITPDTAQAQPGVTEEELLKMQFEKDEYGNRRLSVDPAFRAKFDKLKQQVWGSEEHRQIVGS